MSVAVQNLTKIFGNQRAVDAVTFAAAKGEVLGFLGPNGAGKSTTMKIATGYLPPSAGTIVVNGYDVIENPGAVRKHVGYLPEHNPLYLDMYVKEYLAFIGKLHGLTGQALTARIKEMAQLCGLTAEQGKKIGSLSKGYRQRVGLAQALIHDPAVLILDEPTTGLDPNQIQEIRHLIKSISKEKTVLFSTHIMQEVTAICDRVVIINQGKIVADSPVSGLEKLIKGHISILAEFETEIEVTLLEAIPEIERVEILPGHTYRLHPQAGKDIRSGVFNLASRHNWRLIGLRQEENTLEDIFRQLTRK